ncbi:MAG: adenylate/guanylate cyclase domain-containing protein [Reichenbachiella sp.]|uniref:adenylate/guanylate cyclase domain-containing protein n=1 Tax=Reichenbachiella sp. TaxID=2184521 RepID=UPI002965E005|nr:adenylate/guanylate cyclase domain-containing protein [Reichenbachiella sp.]MDW3208995.1 adenylate/guanylate cyclase domain-containing protein [Reichenbachiella sp.]
MKWKKNFRDWLFVVSAWITASLCITAIGMFFQDLQFRFLEIFPTKENQKFIEYFSSGFQYIEGALFGFLFGTVFYFVYWLTENTSLRNKSFGRLMFIKTSLYLVGFVLTFFIVFAFLLTLDFTPVRGVKDMIQTFSSWTFYAAFGTFLTLFTIIINFILEVSKKYGPGNLWNMFMGKYHHPVIEHRIFMFLDLKDSTTYAEKLGHIKYSNLIQKCFLYLNEIVFDHNAQIYQYVGDEAVLTWDSSDLEARKLSIELFFAFQKKLASKADKFEKEFGFVPEFKAGINEGAVTAAEVGYIKRDIAYHGDVLNTGARIQDKCNELGKNLLVSEVFAEQIKSLNLFKQELLGEVALKGKERAINIYAVDKA